MVYQTGPSIHPVPPLGAKSQVTTHNSHLASQADVVIDKSSEDWVPQQVSQTMLTIINHH